MADKDSTTGNRNSNRRYFRFRRGSFGKGQGNHEKASATATVEDEMQRLVGKVREAAGLAEQYADELEELGPAATQEEIKEKWAEISRTMESLNEDVTRDAANRVDELSTSFAKSFVEDFIEERQRAREPKEDSDYLAFRLPKSMLGELDADMAAQGARNRSQYVRDAVRLSLRMSGLSGESLRQQVDAILDETMGARLGQAIGAVIVGLGPEVAEEIYQGAAVVLISIFSQWSKASPDFVRERFAKLFEEIMLEGENASNSE